MSAAEAVEQMAKTVAPPKRRFLSSDRLREETKGFVRRGDWEKASVDHLLDLHDAFHQQVYGVEAEALSAKERARARSTVFRLLEKTFEGDQVQLADFVVWLWERESRWEKWRRENGRDGGRLSWNKVFDRKAVADYRVAKERKTKSGK